MKYPRVHARIQIDAPAKAAAGGDWRSFDVFNLSAGGVLLMGGTIPDGTLVDVEIHIGGAQDPIAVKGRVTRQESVPNGLPAFAVIFLDVTPEMDGRLTQAVTEGFKALGARILGQVRMEMHRRGITDVAAVAEEMHRIKKEQAQEHLFSSDLYTENGSDTVATIVSATTAEKRECIVWSLNLYLGLNRHPRVIEKTRMATASFGTGCGTSAPSGGLNRMHRQIEGRVAEMVGKECAVIFPTGYTANLGALSALPGPRDLLLFDREAHASMLDGARLSGKKWLAFKHNDVDDLAEKLSKFGPNHQNVFVAVESAYSMSGNLAPLQAIVELKKKFRFYLYVDEAHTFGFYGDRGRGYCQAMGVTADVDFIMSTFSKSTASIGGFVAGEAKYCTLLQASATPYIFQACLSPPDAATILAALDEIQGDPSLARRLHESNRSMRALLVREGFNLGTSQSPVIPVYVPDLEKLYMLCARLYLDGIYSVPVVYPAVNINEGRIRFIVNATHTQAQIERTVHVLASHARALGIIAP